MIDSSDGSFNLKHRLVGATALILIAVILLPRVFTGTDDLVTEGRATPEPQLSSESSDSRGVRQTAAIDIVEDSSIVDDVDSKEQRIVDPKLSTRKDSGAHKSLVDDAMVSSSDSIVTGWVAQIGIFRSKDNVANLYAQLRADGIEANMEQVFLEGVEFTRVWLGPFSTRVEALRQGNKAMIRSNTLPILKEWPGHW